jgi:hypothetical protein
MLFALCSQQQNFPSIKLELEWCSPCLNTPSYMVFYILPLGLLYKLKTHLCVPLKTFFKHRENIYLFMVDLEILSVAQAIWHK